MHVLKNDYAGFYKPAFFTLIIDKGSILTNGNKVKEEFKSVLFHEYIHFLQDIFTTFGLRNISYLVQQYSIINNEILKSDLGYFTVPYVASNNVLLSNKRLFNIYWGTDDLYRSDDDFEVSSIERQANTLEFVNPNVFFINVNIIYREDPFEPDSFYLGAIHFMENMASLLERRLFFTTDHPSFPYKVIETILKHLFIGGDFNDVNLIRFMENALNTYQPAEYLMAFYEYCKTQELTFNANSIEEFNKKYRVEWNNVKSDLNRFFYTTLALARNGFNVLFNHEALEKLKEWSNIILTNVVKIKRSGFSFTQLLVTGGNFEEVDKSLNYLLRKLGTPILSDKSDKVFMQAPKPGLEYYMTYLLGLEAVLNVLYGDTQCSCIRYCKSPQWSEDITNDLCYVSPWERVNKQPLCLFAQLWIIWGFSKKKVHVSG
ncbi:MAG TPA: hypothetical protein VGM63_07060 [Mucilaginibacter sp.]|jgi:hypothetical protein